jgi:mono/diheme cytochrome c family protein
MTESHTRRPNAVLRATAMAAWGWLVATGLHGMAFAQAPPQILTGPPALYTTEQAVRGVAAYGRYCSACHGNHLDDGDFGGPPLRGSYFRNHWGGGQLASLFAFAKNVMPPDNPGSLTDSTYADILAYILQSNGYKPGATDLATDPAAQARMTLGQPGD